MGPIATDNNEITLYYHSNNSLGKQALGYVNATDAKVNAVDISKTKITGTQWVGIAEKLNLSIDKLIQKDHPNFTKQYNKDSNLEENDWIKLLQKHPEIIVYPIAIRGDNYLQIQTPSDLLKLVKADSKGIEPHNENDKEDI